MFSLRNKFCYGTIAVFPDIGDFFWEIEFRFRMVTYVCLQNEAR